MPLLRQAKNKCNYNVSLSKSHSCTLDVGQMNLIMVLQHKPFLKFVWLPLSFTFQPQSGLPKLEWSKVVKLLLGQFQEEKGQALLFAQVELRALAQLSICINHSSRTLRPSKKTLQAIRSKGVANYATDYWPKMNV